MKIQIWAVGKNHEPHFKTSVDLFTARISHYFPVEWRIFSSPKIADAEQLKNAEGKIFLQAIQPGDFVVALDEYGKQMTSPALATFIEKQSFQSTKNLIFIIGGAFGLDAEILKRSDHKWSLSQLTFPHQLVRVILAEQLYRACTILRGERYHHQ